jgi:hypothetical protein
MQVAINIICISKRRCYFFSTEASPSPGFISCKIFIATLNFIDTFAICAKNLPIIFNAPQTPSHPTAILRRQQTPVYSLK